MIHQKLRIDLKSLTITAFVIFIISFAASAQAHRVTIFAWVDGDTIFTESKFGNGQAVKGGKVLVSDEAGNQLLAGETDDNGEFSFAIPQKSALKIVLNATMGHRAEWYVPLSEITGKETIPPEKSVSSETGPKSQPPLAAPVSTHDLENIVEKVLDRKLKPVNRMLAEIQHPGPSFRDIFGGIGYIFGLMGVGAWFRYRK
ncbi:MAG: hypothetical protein JXK94_02205 [Deltaproteobacteria bacterium]|nr:hypothetical protein [Deltaproteobacteria bacterium]